VIVTYAHFRTIPARAGRGYCCGGGRRWCKRHGLDWTDFVKHGIAEETLLATGDGMANALVRWAHECDAAERVDG